MSAAITELRYELTKLGVQFGADPDSIISFPIDPDPLLTYTLDYKAILRKMGRIANTTVPYHALKMNCSTAIMNIVKAGLTNELKAKLKSIGYSIPRSNTFFETPQSVYEFSTTLEDILMRAVHEMPTTESNVLREFIVKVMHFFMEFLAHLFQPSKTQLLINLRGEYEDSLAKSKESLLQLDHELAEKKISQKTYDEVYESGVLLVNHYENKIKEVDEALNAHESEPDKTIVNGTKRIR